MLEGAEDEELQCYLLQLVQALRFERSDKSRLSFFLVKRGTVHHLGRQEVSAHVMAMLESAVVGVRNALRLTIYVYGS